MKRKIKNWINAFLDNNFRIRIRKEEDAFNYDAIIKITLAIFV